MRTRSKSIVVLSLGLVLIMAACITPPGTPLPATPTSQETLTPTIPTTIPSATEPSPTEPATSPTPTGTSETPTAIPETPTAEPPGPLPPISPENAARVQKLARVEEPGLSGFVWSTRGDWLAAIGARGVTVFSPEELAAAGGELPGGGKILLTGPANPAEVFLSSGGETLGILLINESAVQLWNVQTGEIEGRLEWTEHAAPVLYGVLFSPDWRLLAWYTRGTLQFMNVPSGELGPTVNYEEFIQAVSFSREGDFFASATLGTVQEEFIPVIQVWDVNDGEPFATLSGHENPVSLVRFSPDGQFLAAGMVAGEVAVWEVATGQLLQLLEGPQAGVQEMAFTNGGQNLVAVSPGGSVYFWDLASGEVLRSWQGMQAAVSPGGRLIALQSSVGDLMLIDPASGEELRGLETPPSLSLLSFSTEGRFLAGFSPEEPALHLWGIPE